jgi:hypothetical protein
MLQSRPTLNEVMPVRLSGSFKFDMNLTQFLGIVASILSIVGSIATLAVLWK